MVMYLTKSVFSLVGLITFFAALNSVWFLINNTFDTITYDGYGLNNTIEKRDWHDYEAMKLALARKGPGETGEAVQFDAYRKTLYEKYGFDAVLSDIISVNRSVPDVRPAGCLNIKYAAKLPKTTIIIISYNERLSVLIRTIYGIINRTPDELIQEIILVDDCSSWADMQRPLTNFLNEHFPSGRSKVHLLRLKKRSGLMVARMEGARAASKDSEVFVFMDSHFEVNYNWLPPLLDPITHNRNACTVPAIDRISFETFEYTKKDPFRGYFDWELNFKMRLLQQDEIGNPALNFREYVMIGGAMAIQTDFFWRLGGFDEGMVYWGGEQYEMSFKIWMCGGELISVPCSRIGHIYRDPNTKGNTNLYGNYSFEYRNFRRLIDVWLDNEHRQYVLNHHPIMRQTDPGDISSRIAIREDLKCKSFSWMLDNVMPDLKRIYPPVEPDDYGSGLIHNHLHSNACIAINDKNQVFLANCNHKNRKNFQDWQLYWHYTWRCEFRIRDGICLESDISKKHVNTYYCHLFGGNQKWYYDPINQWIIQLEYNVCMIANERDMRVELTKCDQNNMAMKWIIDFVNRTTTNRCLSPEKNII